MAVDWLGFIRGENVDVLLARKEYARAAERLRAEVRRQPRDRRLRLLLADTLVSLNRDSEALAMMSDLADDLSRQGKAAQAIAVLKRIRVLNPRYPDVEGRLSRMLDAARARAEDDAESAPPPAEAPAAAASDTAPDVPTELKALGGAPLFREFTAKELLALLEGLTLQLYEPGQIVVTEGEPGASMYVVAAGRLRAYVKDKAGASVQVAEIAEGEHVGEMSLLTGRRRSATLTAATRCELLCLDKAALAEIVKAQPNVKAVLREFYTQREKATAALRGRKARPTPAALVERRPPVRRKKAAPA